MGYTRYETIKDNRDRQQKRNKLRKHMETSSVAFNLFVLSSVDFFYHDGNKQVAIVNDLLDMAKQCHGMNCARLASYLKKVIPHNLVEAKDHDSTPKFTTKKGDYPSFVDVQDFVNKNPLWYKYGAVDKSTFYRDKYLKSVITKLKKEGVSIDEFAMELYQNEAS